MPKYSLVVPTSDRGHLLEGALDALARLEHDSYEVIVSNNYSEDDTESIAKRWTEKDPRFRHVRTDKKLCMSDHWDFALSVVEGDYFLYVGDDDSFSRDILRILDYYLRRDGIEGIYWRQALYYHPSWFQPEYTGKLYIPPYSGREWHIPATEAIDQMFKLVIPGTFPIGTSFCFKTSIARSITARTGRFFVRPYPDFTSTMMYLPHIESYLYLDMALSVIGKSADSNAAGSVPNGSKMRQLQFVQEHGGSLYPHMPVRRHFTFNGIAESVAAVQSLQVGAFATYSIDWIKYFFTMSHLLHDEEKALDSGTDKKDLWRAFLKMPLKTQVKAIPYGINVLRRGTYRLLGRLKRQLCSFIQNGIRVPEKRDVHDGDFCMAVSNLVDCSQELTNYNAHTGYSPLSIRKPKR